MTYEIMWKEKREMHSRSALQEWLPERATTLIYITLFCS